MHKTLCMAVRMATNLSLPVDLVAEIDAVAGRRQRSAFVEEAVRKALRRERLRAAMERTAGAWRGVGPPEWATSEGVVNWVRELRAEETNPGPEPEHAVPA
jgi:metal-responsive CopG/Arc/MetJ family transcriptional regulator